jgi:DNA-binding CsgD family transcriptional regulator
MDESEHLSALVGAIYDAALDAALWPDVLLKTSHYVPGGATSLFAKDASAKSLVLHYDDGGIEPRYVQLYAEKFAKIDPSTTVHYFAEIGEPTSTINFAPIDEFQATRFYREWVKPQGLVDFMTVALEKTATTVAMLGVFRHDRHGLADDASLRRMRLIAPHIRRAVAISRAIDLKAAQAATFSDAFDKLSSCMLLVDATGRIVHANAAAMMMLASDNVLRAVSGRIAAHDPQAGKGLRDVFEAAGMGDAAVGMRGIALPIVARDGENYVCYVLPLTSGARSRTGSTLHAAAVMLVQKVELAALATPEVIAKAYKLTPTELRVLIAVAEIGGAPEVAEAFGIAETTVKFHLKSLFEKTGARRQADLVKLLAGFANPLAS